VRASLLLKTDFAIYLQGQCCEHRWNEQAQPRSARLAMGCVCAKRLEWDVEIDTHASIGGADATPVVPGAGGRRSLF